MIYLVSYKTSRGVVYHLYYNSDDNLIYEGKTFHGNTKNIAFTDITYRYDISNHSLCDYCGVTVEGKAVKLPETKNIYNFHITYSKKHILEMVEKAIFSKL